MRIADLLVTGRPVFSFEFFPPKTPAGEAGLFRTIDHLRELEPAFVSVTYGAGGSTRDKTVDLVRRIKHDIGIETMAHLTCVGAVADEIDSVLRQLRAAGIENVLALRGDAPNNDVQFTAVPGGFQYASQLVTFIRQRGYEFCVAAAAYPEGHVECRDRDLDLQHLKAKVDAGADLLITQLFFDNRDFDVFVERARLLGIRSPIIPGIMPITNLAQIERFTSMCGARIPDELRQRLLACGDDEQAVRAVGVEHAFEQCRDLLARGAAGIHFYTLNQSLATRAICERLQRN